MPVSTVDERRVYYACRPIFSGGQAGVRKPDRVLDVLKNHAHFLRPLVKTMKLEQVADICRSLLALKVFESVAMAKIVRPELFAQPISTGAMDKIENNMAVPASPKSTALVVPSPTKDYRRSESSQRSPRPHPSSPVPMYPGTLTYSAQHAILTAVQQSLEHCCFSWAKSHRPLLLEENGWDCPEAVELTAWTKFLRTIPEVDMRCTSSVKESYNSISSRVDELRHTAVHRLAVSRYQMDDFLTAARQLAEVLEDTECASRLEDLRTELRSRIIAVDHKMDALNEHFDKGVERIHQRIAELEKEQLKLVREAESEYDVYRSVVGGLLKRYVRSVFNRSHQQAPVDFTSHPGSSSIETDTTPSTECANREQSAGQVVDQSV